MPSGEDRPMTGAAFGRSPRPLARLASTLVLVVLAGCFVDQLTAPGLKPGDIQFTIAAADSTVVLGGHLRILTSTVTTARPGPLHVTWTSSLPNIASVDSGGVIFGHAKGTALITARLTAPELDSAIVRSGTIRVRYGSIAIDSVDSITGLGLVAPLVVRGRDSSGTAVALIANAQVDSFKVANAAVVVLDTGTLRSHANGSTTVTAFFEGLTASRTVTVHQIAKTITFASPALVFPALHLDTSIAVTVLDTHDSLIASPSLNWSSKDPTAATVVAATGVMQALKVANDTILVKADTVTARLPTSVVQVAVGLTRFVGDSQAGTVGLPITVPPGVKVVDRGGAGVPGAAVTFFVAAGGGNDSGTTPTSDTAGVARVSKWVLGTAAGIFSNHLTATSGALTPVTFIATGLPGPPKQVLKVVGDSQSATVGSATPLRPQVQVRDTFGNAVFNVTVTFKAVGQGTPSGTTPKTDSSGLASVGSWLLGNVKGPNRLSASIGVDSTQFTATGTAAAPKLITPAAGVHQNATVGTAVAIAPSVRVTDSLGNGVQSVVVTFAPDSGSGSVTGSVQVTDANGLATLGSWTLDTLARTDTLRASAPGLPDTVFTGTATAGTATQMSVSAGDNQSDTVGHALGTAAAVVVRDQYGNPKPGVVVTFAVTAGGGSDTGSTRVTNAAGVAAVGQWTLGTSTGINTLRATANAGALVVNFTAHAKSGAGANISLSSGDGQFGPASSALPAPYFVRVTDQFGNGVAGVTVIWTVTSGGGSVTASSVTDTLGLAKGQRILGSTIGVQTAEAASGGLGGSPVLFSATATGGAPAQMAINAGGGQTATVGAAVPILPSVKVTDLSGNPSPNVTVTFSVNAGNGVITGASQLTAANGIATLTSWTLDTLAKTDTLTASSAGLTSQIFTATGSAGAAAKIALSAGTGQTDTVNHAVAVAPAVLVTDQHGNPKSGVSVTFAVTAGGGSLTGATPVTGANGIATLGSWTLGTATGVDSLTATAGGLTGSPVKFGATAIASHATQIAVNAGNGQSDTVALPIAIPPSVIVKDQFNNPVAGVAVTFTAVNSSLTGGTPSTSALGVATVGSWTLGDTAGVSNDTLTATAAGLTGSPLHFVASALAGVPKTLAASGAIVDTAVVGQAVPNPRPTVLVKDQFGNPTPGVTVTFALGTPGRGAITGASIPTNAAGTATVGTWTLDTLVGTDSLLATAAGVAGSTVIFSGVAQHGVASKVMVAVGDSQSAIAATAVPVPPAVKVTDQYGNGVPGVSVTFAAATGGGSVTAATPTSDAAGIAVVGSWTLGAAPGANTLTATHAGLTGSPVTFSATAINATAHSMALNGGDAQVGTVGTALSVAYSVVVKDISNAPVAGVPVAWAVLSGGGSISPATSLTNASGIATATRTLGPAAGTQKATASVGGLVGSPVTFTADASAAGATHIAANTVTSQSTQVGQGVAVPPSVLVTDSASNPVANVAVTFAVTAGGGSITGPATVFTNVSGIATVGGWTVGTSTAVTNTLTASSGTLGGSPVTFSSTVTPGGASQLVKVAGDSQVVGVNTTIVPSVRVEDSFGNPVSGVLVHFAVANGGGSVSAPDATSSLTGLAQPVGWTLGTVAGANSLTATSLGLIGSPITFVATGTPGAAFTTTSVVTLGASVIVSGTTTIATLQAKDLFGNNETSGGLTVVFGISGGSSVASISATRDSGNGQYTATLTGVTAGTASNVTATIGGSPVLTALPTLTVVAGVPTNIALFTGNHDTAVVNTGVTTLPAVKVTDANGNGVAGFTVTFAVSGGGGSITGASPSTNTAGVATLGSWTLGTKAGPDTVTVNVPGLIGAPIVFVATAIPAGALPDSSRVFVSADTVAAGSAVTVTLQAKDQFGNNVTTGGLTVSFNIGGSSTGVLGSVTDHGDGTYTTSFTGQHAAGASTLGAVFSLKPVGFNALITVIHGPASSLTKNLGDGQTAMIGTAVPVAPSVFVLDAFSNVVPNQLVTFSVLSGNVRDTLGNLTTSAAVRSALAGTSTVPAWILGLFQGAFSLSASITGSTVQFSGTATTPTVLTSVRLGNPYLLANPAVISADPNGPVWVGHQSTGRLSEIDGFGDTAVATTFTVGGPPAALHANPFYGGVYVTGTSVPPGPCTPGPYYVAHLNGSGLLDVCIPLFSRPGGIFAEQGFNNILVPEPSIGAVEIFDVFGNSYGQVFTGNRPGRVAVDYTVGVGVVTDSGGSGNVYILNICGTGCVSSFPFFLGIGGPSTDVAVDPTLHQAYVTTTSGLTIINTTCSCVVSSIPMAPGGGVSVDQNTHYVYVTDHFSNRVNVVDGSGLSVIGTVNVGRGPVSVAAMNSTGRAFVVNAASGTISAVQGTGFLTTIARSSGPAGIGLNPFTGLVYAANTYADNVSVIDATTNTLVDGIPVPSPRGVAVNPYTNTVYVSEGTAFGVFVINGATSTAVTNLGLGDTTTAIAVNAKTNRVYVAAGTNVVAIDGVTLLTTTIPIGAGIAGITVDTVTNYVYVTGSSGTLLYVIDGNTNGVVSSSGAIGIGEDVGANDVTHRVYAADAPGGNNYFVRVYQGAVSGSLGPLIASVPLSDYPAGLGVNPVTNAIFVPLPVGTAVISGDLNSIVTTLPGIYVGNGGVAVNRGNGRIYFTNGGGFDVRVIQN